MESATIQAIVWDVNYAERYAVVIIDNTYTYVYPQDGALPQIGQKITLVRNGADFIPIASSQRVDGTIRGAIEAEAFVGVSLPVVDVWETQYEWTPLDVHTEIAQPTEGVDPAIMRLTRRGGNGRVQASTLIALEGDRRYIALELSTPPATAGGRDCWAKLEWLVGATVIETHLYHLDNLFLDPISIQSEPLFPPAFTTHVRITVYSESTVVPVNQWLDLRIRAWTVPVVQGGAVLDLDGNVLMDHRGIISNGIPLNAEPLNIVLNHGTTIWDFPLTFSAASEYVYKPLGPWCNINLSFTATSAASPSTDMRFKLPYVARNHTVFNATYLDTGVRWYGGNAHVDPGSDICHLHHFEGAGNNGNVNHNNPFAFASGDIILVSGMFPIQP